MQIQVSFSVGEVLLFKFYPAVNLKLRWLFNLNLEDFDDHNSASYDLAMGLELEQEKKRKEERRLSQNEFSELIKRNTDAFVSGPVGEDSDFDEDPDDITEIQDRIFYSGLLLFL